MIRIDSCAVLKVQFREYWMRGFQRSPLFCCEFWGMTSGFAFWTPGYANTWLCEYLALRIPGFANTWLCERLLFQNARLCERLPAGQGCHRPIPRQTPVAPLPLPVGWYCRPKRKVSLHLVSEISEIQKRMYIVPYREKCVLWKRLDRVESSRKSHEKSLRDVICS